MPINYLKRIQLGEFDDYGYRINPSIETDSIIEGFYVFHRDLKDDSHLIFNDGSPVLVVMQDQKDSVIVKDHNGTTEIKGAWASAGPVKNVYVKYNDNTEQLLIVRFFPGAFYKLFGLNHQYFKNFPVAPFDCIARDNCFSITDLFAYHTTKERISYIENYVLRSFKDSNAPEKFHRLLNNIQKIKGISKVQNLATTAGVNYKSLERSFFQHTGLLPKDYIKLQRFFNAYVSLVGSSKVDLLAIAISNGYYDTSHFLKDFKAFTGQPPLRYLKLANIG